MLPLTVLFILSSCNIPEVFTEPTEREAYIRTLKDQQKIEFKEIGDRALQDSVLISTPFSEWIVLDSSITTASGFRLSAKRGEAITISSRSNDILIDAFLLLKDSLDRFRSVLQPIFPQASYYIEVDKDAEYLIRAQGRYEINDVVELKITTHPQFAFPVSGGKNRDIGSFWGDPREGGKRKHKGIDIFAKRGTPLLAATEAKVRSVRERGRGGKQVWLYDNDRDLSVYYAHLDSQYVREGQYVKRGDTIGTVGNTGNARTTPPHLHFAIYKPYKGAIDPIHYVRTQDEKTQDAMDLNTLSWSEAEVNKNGVDLRIGPDRKSGLIRQLNMGELLKIIGVAGRYLHVRDDRGRAGYLFHSSVRQVNPS